MSQQKQEKPKLNVGIDLGTTFSSIAVYHNNQIEILKDVHGRETIPSWVCFEQADKLITIVGEEAKKAEDVGYVVYDAKRVIGRKFKEVPKGSTAEAP